MHQVSWDHHLCSVGSSSLARSLCAAQQALQVGHARAPVLQVGHLGRGSSQSVYVQADILQCMLAYWRAGAYWLTVLTSLLAF